MRANGRVRATGPRKRAHGRRGEGGGWSRGAGRGGLGGLNPSGCAGGRNGVLAESWTGELAARNVGALSCAERAQMEAREAGGQGSEVAGRRALAAGPGGE
eukprot:scaffold6600_cov125-Isochrysis_galbana.AAC.8